MKTAVALCAGLIIATAIVCGNSFAAGTLKPKMEREKIFVFTAHPDDELACAGTLLLMKDIFDIHIMVMTHGERGCGETGYRDGSTKARRALEEQSVCDMLGATLHWCNEIDGDSYANREVCHRVAKMLNELKPRAVIGMWPIDFHCDHVMASACIIKAIGIAGMRDVIELYFTEQSYDNRSFYPVHFVDVTEVMELKRELIRKYICQNANDRMCQLEMDDGAMRAQRCASYNVLPQRSKHVERFAAWDGKPQGSRCIFNELPPPKGWSQDWTMAKPSRYTPEGGMK